MPTQGWDIRRRANATSGRYVLPGESLDTPYDPASPENPFPHQIGAYRLPGGPAAGGLGAPAQASKPSLPDEETRRNLREGSFGADDLTRELLRFLTKQSESAPGSVADGVAGSAPAAARAAGKNAREIVPLDTARRLGGAVKLPGDKRLADAIANTPGARLTPDGLVLDLHRWQKPDQAGQPSVRGSVFYLADPNGSPYAVGDAAFGGTQRVSGTTLFRRPLVAEGRTGGDVPQAAADILYGRENSQALTTQALHVADQLAVLPPEQGLELVGDFLHAWGGSRRDAALIVKNSPHYSQQFRGLIENVVSSEARKRGYDAIVGYAQTNQRGAISEVVDLRESHYPTPGGGFTLHSAPSLMERLRDRVPSFRLAGGAE